MYFKNYSLITITFVWAAYAPASVLAQDLTMSGELDGKPERFVQWFAATDGVESSRQALSDLYTSLAEYGQLSTDTVTMAKGERNITDTMIREGSWPGFYGTGDADLNIALCELNVEADSCRFNEDGTPRWVAGPGDQLTIPDYDFKTVYRPDFLRAGEFTTTSDLVVKDSATVLCAHGFATKCEDVPGFGVEKPFAEAAAPILLESNIAYDSLGVDQARLERFGVLPSQGSERFLAAYPELRLEFPISVAEGEALAEDANFNAFMQRNEGNISYIRDVVSESSDMKKLMEELTPAMQVRMGFRKSDGEKLTLNVNDEGMNREQWIFHFDQRVAFEHCYFSDLRRLVSFRSVDGEAAYGTWIANPILQASDTGCTLDLNDGVESASSHGTQTIAALARHITLPSLVDGRGTPPEDLLSTRRTMTNIVHIPIEVTGGTLIRQDILRQALQSIATFSKNLEIRPVIVISLSWDSLHADAVANVITDDLSDAHIFVAAPREENYNTCSRHPAAIKNKNGDPQSNIVSIVGWDAGLYDGKLELSRFDAEDKGYGECHDLAAIGRFVGPVFDGNIVSTVVGSSLATPIAAAAAINVLRVADDNLDPKELYTRMLANSMPPRKERPGAKAGHINLAGAANFENSRLDIDGYDGSRCTYFGELEDIILEGSSNDVPFRIGSGSGPNVNLGDLHRMHRRGPGDEFWVVYEQGDVVHARDLRVLQSNQSTRRIVIDVESMSPDNPGSCVQAEGVEISFALTQVLDIIHNEH
ncbi:MAG: hypothetical protein AAGI10_11660 [Pseudomonadota bacterium]